MSELASIKPQSIPAIRDEPHPLIFSVASYHPNEQETNKIRLKRGYYDLPV